MSYIEKNDYFDYVIIGAGIGGLMFAYQMGQNNRDAKILEQTKHWTHSQKLQCTSDSMKQELMRIYTQQTLQL